MIVSFGCGFEHAAAGFESSLRAPGDVDDLGRLVALATLERLADPGVASVVVGGVPGANDPR